MKFRLPAFAALASLAQLLPAADPIPLPQENSDIPADPAVTWGLLDNGLRYAILPNSEPQNRVSMRLYVDAGSLMENDDQQGLAHFLEHMAFNGTKNFPAGEMVEYFQRLGMGFGNHTNAHTSFNETVYKLELPKSDPEMLDEGMKLFRDYADGMLFDPDEIDDERGIILSEKRDRDSVEWRTFVDQLAFAFPDQRVSKRLPIGQEEVISGAPRERFVEFYDNWYTPNRMAVVVVGDITVAEVEPIVKKYFADLPASEAREPAPMGDMAERGLAAHYHFEKEAGETSISIQALKPRIDPPDNKERRRDDLKLTLASQIINRRLERIVKQPDSPLNSASMMTMDFFDLGFALYSAIDADCKPENWEKAMTVIEQELRRALEHGFTEAELNEAKSNLLIRYQEAAKQMATRQSRQLADEIASRLGSRRVFTSPADDLPRVTDTLEGITPADCQEQLRGLWSDATQHLVFVSGNAVIEDPVVAITKAYESSKQVAVTAPEDRAVGEFAYGKMPEPGAIADRKEVEDLGITQIRFGNQVRANLKVTDFEDATVYVKARIGAGHITEPKPGLGFLLESIFVSGGLEAHSDDELQALFAGKSVEVNFGVDDDAFTLSAQTTPETLAEQLRLLRAFITNPGFREEAESEFDRALDELYQQLEHTPGGFSSDEVSTFLHGGDTRFGFPPKADLAALTRDQAREWVMPELEKGYLEISVVGDFDKEQVVKELAATFGNLPPRAESKPAYTEQRIVKFPAGGEKEFRFESQIPKALAVAHWPTTDIYDIKVTRRLGMLSAILDDRLRVKIREELGDAYSPFAHNLPSDTWTDYGYLFASVTVDPAQTGKVGQVMAEIAADLAKGSSITDDELERAKKPQLVTIEEMRRTNRYWLGTVLEASQEYPDRLDWARSFLDDYASITVGDLNELSKQYLREDTRVTVSIKPDPAKSE